MKTYDLAVVGASLAGALAAVLAAEAGLSVLLLEKGQGPKDRRNLTCGWLGKSLYTMSRIDAEEKLASDELYGKAIDLCRQANGGRLEWHSTWKDFPSDLPFHVVEKSHYRAGPGCGHELARQLHSRATETGQADLLFNAPVEYLERTEGGFVLRSARTKFEAKACLLSVGSFAVEWTKTVCDRLGLTVPELKARLGLRVEVPGRLLRTFLQLAGDLNLSRSDAQLDDIRIGSLVGERDDANLLSAFAYAMPGKPTERTSFMASASVQEGLDAMRVMRIVNTLSNDKIKREKATDFIHGHSVLEHIDQFVPVRQALLDLDKMLPSFLGCAAVYVPEIRISGVLPVDENMRTTLPGLYGAGECTTRVASPLGAMVSAMIAIRSLMEEKNG